MQPGLAIDGFGREIVVGAPYKLDGADFQFFKPTNPPSLKAAAVHIAYSEENATPPAFGYGSCDAEGQNDRVRELLRSHGWQLTGLPPNDGLPSAGVLQAIRDVTK